MKPVLLSALILAYATPAFAQGISRLDCALVTLNFDSENPETIRKQPIKLLGAFKVESPGEEERITKFFKLPKSKWFVVASLYSTDESMPSKSGADSLNMELSLARKRKRNIFITPAYASAELPYGTLEIVRVDMIVRTAKHRIIVIMQCKAVD